MKKSVKTISKILFVCVIICSLLSSCSSHMFNFAERDYAKGIIRKEYSGKEIVSIEKIDTEINGYADNPENLRITEGQKLLFASGEVYSFSDHRGDSEDYNYELEFKYDTTLNEEIIDMLYSAGLFDLEPIYEGMHNGDIHGWTLTVTYADGTTMVSKGENLSPDVFRSSGYAFYNITGRKFLFMPYGEYTNPPGINVRLYCRSKICNHEEYDMTGGYWGISENKGMWRGHEIPWHDKTPSIFEMISSCDSTFYVSIAGYYDQFTSAKVYAYTNDYDNMQEVEFEVEKNFRLFNEPTASLSFDAEPDTNYVIYLEFKLGNAEYIISTVSVDKE